MSHSRRHFLHSAVSAVTLASVAPRSLFAQQPATAAPPDRLTAMRAAAASAKITTKPLRGNISALMGAGGNIAVLPGKEGKLIIDSGYSTARPQLTEALTALSSDPITHLINTHWHVDHTDGNDWMHSSGATVIAHRNTRDRLSTTQHMVAFNMTVPPSPAGAIPTLVFAETDALKINGDSLTLAHYDPAHTDTDISIYFSSADVLHCGDTFFNGLYPFIDYSSGGNIDGMIRASERNLTRASASTIVIPGHGPVGDRAAVAQFHDMLVGVRGTVADLKKQGRSADEVVAAKPTAPFDSTFKAASVPVDNFVRLVYQGV